MQNLLRFIQRYSNFLIFLCLEVAAFLLFLFTQPYQQTRLFSASNTLIASCNMSIGNVIDYFSLAQVNRHLADENAQLNEEVMRLKSLEERIVEQDSGYYYSHLQWGFQPAKVVDMQTSTNHNYLVINKGSRDGVCEGQGILSHDGVVGIVSIVNTHFSLVVPIIHPKMHLSCRIKRNRQEGFLQWNGPSYQYAELKDIGRHVSVQEGDTIVTSGLTGRFPEDIIVGIINQVKLPGGDANYSIKVRLTTDFRSLEYVQVIHNPLQEEVVKLQLQAQ